MSSIADHLTDKQREAIDRAHIDPESFERVLGIAASVIVSKAYKRYALPSSLHSHFDGQWAAASFDPKNRYYGVKHFAEQQLAAIVAYADNLVGQPVQTRARRVDEWAESLEQKAKDYALRTTNG